MQGSFDRPDVKNIISVFQNLPAAVHGCCIDGPRDHAAQPCKCSRAVINDAVCRLSGYSSREFEQIFHGRISELVVQEDRAMYLQAIDELYEYPHEKTIEFRLACKGGGSVRVRDRLRSVRQADGSVWLYALLEETQDTARAEKTESAAPSGIKRVAVRTFGYLNVLIDGQAVAFEHSKAKELFAVLVDRRGRFVSSSELISCLWEDEGVNENTQSRCRKAVYHLKKILAAYGLEELIESTAKGYRRIRTEMIDCDLYHYLEGDEKHRSLFRGAYMTEYSWAEQTLSALLFKREIP